MESGKGHRRGFFFTVMALAILSFMLLTVQVWVRTFEQYDLHAAQRFKGEAIKQVLSALSDQSLSNFANASAFYATYQLVNYTKTDGLESSERMAAWDNPGTGLVAETVRQLMLDGVTGPPSNAVIEYSEDERQAYALSYWQQRMTSAANVLGFAATFSEPQNFTYRQLDAWTVGVYFEIEMNISDIEGTMRQSKRLRANASFPIDGFLDPFITRNDRRQRCIFGASCIDFAERQIFRMPQYPDPQSVRPVQVQEGAAGSGWFYGPVTYDYPDNETTADEISRLSQYVLVRSYDANLSTYADWYGAVVVTNLPGTSEYVYSDSDTGCTYNVTEQTRCLNCVRTFSSGTPGCSREAEIFNQTSRPTISVDGFGGTINVLREGMPDQQYVLIDNEAEDAQVSPQAYYHRLWDMTYLHDMAICGFYVKGEGPSFFQRMLLDRSAPIKNQELGIETFVVGKWAGGADDQVHDSNSRLDWEFYSFSQPLLIGKIKGMMGCKSKEMCAYGSVNATEEGVGKFRLGGEATARYVSGQVSCNLVPSSPCD